MRIDTEHPEDYVWCGYPVLSIIDTNQIGDFRFSVLYKTDNCVVHTWTSGKDLRPRGL